MEIDDDILMQRWQAGDDSAFDALVEKYQKRVLVVAYRFLLNPIEAEDVAQETFLRLYRSKERYQIRDKFSAYLFTIVNRVCFNILRQRRRHPMVSLQGHGKTEDESTMMELKDQRVVSAVQVLEGRERQTMILKTMETLSSDEHMAMVLDHWEDMPLETIAEVMHKSVPAVKSILFRARKKMRAKLSAYFLD